MPRYFFDFTDTGESYPDSDGTELPDYESAKIETVQALVEIARDALCDEDHRELAFQVRDETGKPILQVMLNFEMLAH